MTSRSTRTSRWMRSAATWSAMLVPSLGLVWLLVAWSVLQHPSADAPARADALFVLGPPDRTRMEEALRLMDTGAAPVLVVANPGAQGSGDDSGSRYYALAVETCTRDMGYEVICFQPSPSTTQGEAMKLRELSAQRGWDRVSALTYRQHVPRARMLLERCYPGELHMLFFDYPIAPRGVLRELAYQSGGFVKAWLTPGCDQQLPWRPKSRD